MSWKLIFGLSLFGLFMGLATAFMLPPGIELYAWLGIFALSGVLIAKRAPGRYFMHGLCVSLVDSAWVTLAHVALFDKYVALHGRLLDDLSVLAPRLGAPHLSAHVTMAVAGAAFGFAIGLVLGSFAWVSSKFVVSAQSEFAGW